MSRRHARSGSAAVEFALIVAPFILLLFGGIEFGRLIWTRNALQQTAVATARCMGVRQPPCATAGAIDVARSVTFARTRASSYSVAVAAAGVAAVTSGSCAGQDGFARVTITKSFATVVPLLRSVQGTAYPITVTACFPNQV